MADHRHVPENLDDAVVVCRDCGEPLEGEAAEPGPARCRAELVAEIDDAIREGENLMHFGDVRKRAEKIVDWYFGQADDTTV